MARVSMHLEAILSSKPSGSIGLYSLNSNLIAREALPKLPIGRCHIERSNNMSVAGNDLERERLPNKHHVGLPVLAPISLHLSPSSLRALYEYLAHIPTSSHIGDEHQIEVLKSVDREPDAPFSFARNPTVKHGYNAGTVLGKLEEGRLCHVKVSAGRVAPATVI